MAMEDEQVEFVTIETREGVSLEAKKEGDQLESKGVESPPNSVYLDLRFCKIKWHADTGAPLFCFFSIAALLVFGVLVALLAIMNSKATRPDEVFKFLGQAILTLVGAVVGASASSSSVPKSRRQTNRN